MVILEDSAMERAVWRDDRDDDDDSGDDCVVVVDIEDVKAVLDGVTPNAWALGRALCNAMTARSADAIIFIFAVFLLLDDSSK